MEFCADFPGDLHNCACDRLLCGATACGEREHVLLWIFPIWAIAPWKQLPLGKVNRFTETRQIADFLVLMRREKPTHTNENHTSDQPRHNAG